jgi:hypothetical protein
MIDDFKQTIETCNLALAVDPDYFPACFNKGFSLKSLNMYSESIE